MLSTPEFAEFAETVVPFLHVTTHIQGHPDDDLLKRKNGDGFPTLMILDAEGKTVARPRARNVDAFTAAVSEAQGRAAQRDAKSEAAQYLMDRLLGTYAEPAADREAYYRHRSGLSADQRKQVEREIAEAELQASVDEVAILDRTAAQILGAEVQVALLETLAARDKLGGWPGGALGSRALIGLLAWADARRDAEAFARWLDDLRGVREGLEGNETMFAWLERRLGALRDGNAKGDFVAAFKAR